MSKLFTSYFRIIGLLIFLFSVLVIVFHFSFIGQGFYFAGDTISNFTPAYPGKIGDYLSVFLWSYASWPPGMAFIFHTLRFLPLSIINQHQAYVILVSFLSVCTTYLIARRITDIKIWHAAIIALSLFTGVQAFLFTTALSEPLLILAWIASALCLERFMSTQKERFLLSYILLASLIPLSRYVGIWVLLGLNIFLFFYVLATWKDKKYSPILVITSVILTFAPISIYLIRNYLLSQNFIDGIASLIDPRFGKLDFILISFLPNVLLDNWIFFIAAGILGMQIKWNKSVKYFLILFCFSISFYYLGYALALTKYRVAEIFHSRYLSVAYPELILSAFCLGSFLRSKTTQFSKILLMSLTLVIYVLGNQILLSFENYKQEINSPQSTVGGVEYSADIKRLCGEDATPKYIFLQESSLNWIGQGLGFYCQPISIIPFDANIFELPKGAYLLTPYRLSAQNLQLQTIFRGDKEMRVYRALEKTTLNINDELKRQIPLDWFSGVEFINPRLRLQDGEFIQEPKEWVSFESLDLKFSTKIPNTWQTYVVPQKKAVFFISDISRGLRYNSEYYSISAQVIILNDISFEELYFPRDRYGTDRKKLFVKEEKGVYLIYKTDSLNTQDNMVAVFITKDGKNFIRFSLAPYLKEKPTETQKKMVEYLDKIVGETKLF